MILGLAGCALLVACGSSSDPEDSFGEPEQDEAAQSTQLDVPGPPPGAQSLSQRSLPGLRFDRYRLADGTSQDVVGHYRAAAATAEDTEVQEEETRWGSLRPFRASLRLEAPSTVTNVLVADPSGPGVIFEVCAGTTTGAVDLCDHVSDMVGSATLEVNPRP